MSQPCENTEGQTITNSSWGGSTNIVAVFEKALDTVPEKIKNEIPNALATASAIMKTLNENSYEMTQLHAIHSYVSTPDSASKEVAEDLLKACQHFGVIKSNSSTIYLAIQSKDVADESVQKCVKSCLQQASNNILLVSLGISLAGLIVEIGRLTEIYIDVCAAEQFEKYGFGAKKVQIQSKLDRIPEKIMKFAEGIQKSSFEKKSDRQKTKFFIRKSRERDEISELLGEIEGNIGNLETDVNGKIEKLNAYAKPNVPAAVGQFIQGASLGVSLSMVGAAANPLLAVATGATIAAHLVAVGAGYALSNRASTVVEKLRKKLEEIIELRSLVKDQRDSLNQLFNEFSDILEDDDEEVSID